MSRRAERLADGQALTAVRSRGLGLALALALALAGCASPGPDRSPIAARTPAGLGLSEPAGSPLPARWWTAWGDPQLDALVERALADAPGITLAQARVARAQALAEVRRAAAQPQLAFSADVTRERYSENGLLSPVIAGQVRDTGDLRVTASWSPDLYGQQAVDLASALGQARAAQADASFAATTLAVQVARGYVALAHLLAQRALAAEGLGLREQAAALVRQRVQAGLDSAVDLVPVEAGLPEARQQMQRLDEQVGLARSQLALLAGLAPQALDTLTPDLARIAPPPLSAAPGTDLLGRRADIVAARWRVEAAVQDVTLARLQFHPNLSLGAFVGLNSLGLGQLLRAGSLQAAVGPALRLPIFDGDRLRQQLGARRADLDAAIAQYNATLLDAVREAADGLASTRALEAQARSQDEQLARAREALTLARARHAAGLGNRLAVLQAEWPLLAQRRQQAELRARILDNQVLFVRALGGGWQDDQPALPPLAAAPAPRP